MTLSQCLGLELESGLVPYVYHVHRVESMTS
jgi:hypothetical protein